MGQLSAKAFEAKEFKLFMFAIYSWKVSFVTGRYTFTKRIASQAGDELGIGSVTCPCSMLCWPRPAVPH